ncbi:hypothetical protein HMPREF1318_1387 [Actinomyces massiliensis F0489]|uniref:Uncharacterized protein n=1 Tax=Actinomyces massiliensis F0489 TaxID=1125718 RepID=J0MY52_9ACTO|nr:hypothetical protein HMPREF1318_1387 [Actinomyces massiliensis F0489]
MRQGYVHDLAPPGARLYSLSSSSRSVVFRAEIGSGSDGAARD